MTNPPAPDPRDALLARLHGLLDLRLAGLELAEAREQARAHRRAVILETRRRYRWLRRQLGERIVGDAELISTISMLTLRAMQGRGAPGPRVLITGPTGSGKSAISRAIAEVSGLPYLDFSSAHSTESGWAGISVEETLGRWTSGGAARGIVCVQEIDKIVIPRGSSGNSPGKYRGQQSSLLGLLGREPIQLPGGGVLETAGLTVIATGAFAEEPWSSSGHPPSTADLMDAGIIAELADRLETRIALPHHSARTLTRLYARQMRSEFRGVRDLCTRLGFELRIARETYAYVATAAAERAAGPREGRAWIEQAVHAALARALEARRRPGILRVTPDDVCMPAPSDGPPKRDGSGPAGALR
jgi:SpoVK/Ycf46/Vps4 family AAA+-type ATPase